MVINDRGNEWLGLATAVLLLISSVLSHIDKRRARKAANERADLANREHVGERLSAHTVARHWRAITKLKEFLEAQFGVVINLEK